MADDVTVNRRKEGSLSKAHIQSRPNVEQKITELGSQGGLDGQLVVLYDVEREEDVGEIRVVDGYFIHFFAPAWLPIGGKHAMFALDKSGSMCGRKMEQTKVITVM